MSLNSQENPPKALQGKSLLNKTRLWSIDAIFKVSWPSLQSSENSGLRSSVRTYTLNVSQCHDVNFMTFTSLCIDFKLSMSLEEDKSSYFRVKLKRIRFKPILNQT